MTEPIHTESGIIVSKDVTIRGQGADKTIVQAYATLEDAPNGVFLVAEDITVTIRGLTIRHGNPHLDEDWRSGGGILNRGTLTLENCVVSHNVANTGGGILTTGVLSDGPFSVLSSFSKIDYGRIYNGGPITLELSDTVFREPESIRKVAMLVRAFAQLGCQQLQINSLNAARLLEARCHPELHRDLIVRVWGWSGYFCELAPEYQEHILTRTIYSEA